LSYFIAGTTARTAAALVGVNKSTSAYYFHRLRELICEAVEDDVPFSGEIEVDESYFGGADAKAKGVEALPVKQLYLVSSGAMEVSLQKSFLIAGEPRCKRLFGVGWILRA
jgi:hypothetical protein